MCDGGVPVPVGQGGDVKCSLIVPGEACMLASSYRLGCFVLVWSAMLLLFFDVVFVVVLTWLSAQCHEIVVLSLRELVDGQEKGFMGPCGRSRECLQSRHPGRGRVMGSGVGLSIVCAVVCSKFCSLVACAPVVQMCRQFQAMPLGILLHGGEGWRRSFVGGVSGGVCAGSGVVSMGFLLFSLFVLAVVWWRLLTGLCELGGVGECLNRCKGRVMGSGVGLSIVCAVVCSKFCSLVACAPVVQMCRQFHASDTRLGILLHGGEGWRRSFVGGVSGGVCAGSCVVSLCSVLFPC